jgi:tetratricopeptide (TPR) repeat protein
VAARKAGLIDEAISEYQAAVRLDPSLSEAHYNLAVLYVREKQAPDLAAKSFQRFLELDPQSEAPSPFASGCGKTGTEPFPL